MTATAAEPLIVQDDKVRLYSSGGVRTASDVVDRKHQRLHEQLERWGAWNRERYEAGECRSIEGNFDAGGRTTKRATVSLPPDPVYRAIDEAWRAMPWQQQDSIRMFYVGAARRGRKVEERCSPKTICISMRLRFEDFAVWMYDCRAIMANVLRLQGNAWVFEELKA